MKTRLYFLLTALFFLVAVNPLTAQQPPFYNEIQAFKKLDSAHMPPKQAILFTGSSSFRFWTDVQDYFPGYTIINRGFGGSSLPDVIRYANDIIFPYQPKQVVLYCGENDLADSDTVTAQTVFTRFKTLFQLIRQKLPGVPVAFVSLKPSPSREHLFTKMVDANRLIRNFIEKEKNAAYIDVFSKMRNSEGSVMKDIFKADNLHMNAKGYAIWKTAIEPYLVK
jgi:lysophospholipase L1-like esterase